MLVCDEDWNPFLWPPWQTEVEMVCACPPAQACWLGDGDAFVSTVLKAKMILLLLPGSSIWSKQKRNPEPGDTLYDMYSDRNYRDLWATFAYVRQGMAEQEEGDCCQSQGAVWAGHTLPASIKLKNFLRQCRVALTSYWHWHNIISVHHSIYAVCS